MLGDSLAPSGEHGRNASRDALIERVVAGAAFRKSARLRELLYYLCERAQADPDHVIHEGDIGAEVFGRQPGYDTAQDPLVRVQVSQLRKRLQQHFETEGKSEPVLIEIPRGAYTPVFPRRVAEPMPGLVVLDAPAERSRHRWNWWTAGFAGLAAVLGVVAVWALMRSPLLPAPGTGPAVNRFWAQLLENGEPACIVTSDPVLVLFENMLGRGLTLSEYRIKDFNHVAAIEMSDLVQREFAKGLAAYQFSSVVDTQLVATLTLLNAAQRTRTEVVPAREFGVDYLRSHNVILLGSRLSNPWVEMFETQLNFRSMVPGRPDYVYFQNMAPRAGESRTFTLDWGKLGFCRVALLRNPAHGSHVLMISGTDIAATEAGGEFITSEPWVRMLRTTLKLGERERFPLFEALLRVEYQAKNAAPRFTIVGWRLPAATAPQ